MCVRVCVCVRGGVRARVCVCVRTRSVALKTRTVRGTRLAKTNAVDFILFRERMGGGGGDECDWARKV